MRQATAGSSVRGGNVATGIWYPKYRAMWPGRLVARLGRRRRRRQGTVGRCRMAEKTWGTPAVALLHDRRIIRLASLGRGSWEARFKRTLLLHHHAQLCASDGRIPTLDDFLSVRRETLGTSVVFDLAELLEVFPFPEFLQGVQRERLERIKQCAFNIIAWSIDVASYHLTLTPCHFNLLTVLMTHNHLSIQGAMNLAGSMIKDAFSSFCALENELVDSLQPAQSILSSLSSLFEWQTKTKGSEASYSSPTDPSKANARLDDVKRYIQALKDCIAGSVHWVYETELFFGKKGGEVRSFGWVFAHMKYVESGTEPVVGVNSTT